MWPERPRTDRRSRRQPATRSVVIAGTTLLLIIQFVLTLISEATSGIFSHLGMDFLTTYTAATIIGEGRAHHLYNLWEQVVAQAAALSHYNVQWADRALQPYVAPPFLGLIAMPLRFLPAAGAYLIWVALSAALCLATGWLIDRQLKLGLGRLMPLITLSFFPVYYTLFLGQSEAILLLGLTGFILLSLRGKDLPAGLALGLLCIKPPLLLAPLIYLVVKRRWNALLGLATVCTSAAAVSIALLGRQGLAAYTHLSQELSQPAGTVATNVPGMINIRGTIVRLLPNAPASAQQLAILAVSIALIGATVAVWRRGGVERGSAVDASELALLAVTTVLVSYHTLIHTGVLLLPAFALLWTVVRQMDLGGRYRTMLLGLAALTWIGPTIAYIPLQTSLYPAIVMTPMIFGLWLMSAECAARATDLEPALAKVRAHTRSRSHPVESRSRW